MSVTEHSALVRFIQTHQPPINSSRSGEPHQSLVLSPPKISKWKVRLAIAGTLLGIGFIAGLAASRTGPGRWALGSSAAAPSACPDEEGGDQDKAAGKGDRPPVLAMAAPAALAPSTPAPASTPAPPAAAPAPASSPAPAPDATWKAKHKKGARQGSLALKVKPACDIVIDGEKTGLKTPQRKLTLDAGKHRIELVNADLGIRERLKVKVRGGRTTKVKRTLHPD